MRRAAIILVLAFPNLPAADTGEKLFQTHCAPCHGPQGDGGRGSNLAVRTLPRAPDDATLAGIVSLGIPGTQMPGTRMTATELADLVAYVRSLGRRQAAPVEGDARRGETLFWSNGNCGACHTVGSRGGRTGPDLTDVGARRSPAWLRKALEEPEAEIPDKFAVYRRIIPMPDNFLQVRVVTLDGKSITGERVDEDTFTIQLRDYGDHLYSFRKDELREIAKDWGKSPMPSYRTMFSPSELQDVVAYLASLRGAP
jgi:putative heme-binding domain-containing protein